MTYVVIHPEIRERLADMVERAERRAPPMPLTPYGERIAQQAAMRRAIREFERAARGETSTTTPAIAGKTGRSL